MGWTWTYGITGCEVSSQVLRSYAFESDTVRSEVLAHSIQVVRGVAYLAVRCTPKAKDGYTFGIKEMDESAGPCEQECPARILDLLSPLPEAPAEGRDPHEYARGWRQHCRENLSNKAKTRKALKAGAIVTTPHPLRWDRQGFECSRFEVVAWPGRGGRKRWVFRTAQEGVPVTLVGLRKASLAQATITHA